MRLDNCIIASIFLQLNTAHVLFWYMSAMVFFLQVWPKPARSARFGTGTAASLHPGIPLEAHLYSVHSARPAVCRSIRVSSIRKLPSHAWSQFQWHSMNPELPNYNHDHEEAIKRIYSDDFLEHSLRQRSRNLDSSSRPYAVEVRQNLLQFRAVQTASCTKARIYLRGKMNYKLSPVAQGDTS
jgi:hypothetical protein